ncbi:LxmA leader domain family RiPP [Nocardiopsis changdeensis]|uniref:LxmA leader domain family RiPP n=1 Tax=Nocardiopsis changdeensis TaxID=2831969 RepID=A0ABX8BLX6_9ACTN|nr:MULTISPECIES: LxmA leader domain family RiPP [Nocardiopsis]QKW31880.1 hypothetical protein HUT17_02020 [Nocardiopsis flavescens]QUX23176.1 LxmA leader domain family RiPP [Nocardiopsis changdeensis]QYX39119.1 LxmA leader domain family RiPP [Nocardiopsis sp. MT53]
MTEKNLFEGADDYTTPAEIAEEHEVENPEITPTVTISFVSGAAASAGATKALGC